MRFWLSLVLAWLVLDWAVANDAARRDLSGVDLQQESTESLWVDDPRPLAASIRELQNRYGWIVTYEDTTYRFAGDVQNYSAPNAKRSTSGPRGGFFLFHWRVDESTASTPSRVLSELLTAHHEAALPGRFGLVQSENAFREDVFHVVPEMSRDTAGAWKPTSSRLDVRITIPAKDRLTLQMLEQILQVTSSRAGVRIGLGSVPVNAFINTMTSDGASDEVARDVLMRTLGATGRRDLSWVLGCSPDSDCLLNVYPVVHERFAADVPKPRWAPSTMPR